MEQTHPIQHGGTQNTTPNGDNPKFANLVTNLKSNLILLTSRVNNIG